MINNSINGKLLIEKWREVLVEKNFGWYIFALNECLYHLQTRKYRWKDNNFNLLELGIEYSIYQNRDMGGRLEL